MADPAVFAYSRSCGTLCRIGSHEYNTTGRRTMSHVSEIPGLLQGLSFFCQLTSAEINQLVPLCTVKDGRAGERLIEQNDVVRDLFFLLIGEADVIKKGPGGTPFVLASLGKGTVLGEMSFFDHGVASATVKTTTPFKALTIQQAALQKLLESNP